MAAKEPNIYDPDPTDMQLHALDAIGMEGMQPADLTKPEATKFLALLFRITAAHLKAAERNVSKLSDENRSLLGERESLRIDLAKLQERSHFSWLEVPISFVIGFAINMLAADYANGLGWFMLLIGLFILGFMRLAELTSAIAHLAQKVLGRKGDG